MARSDVTADRELQLHICDDLRCESLTDRPRPLQYARMQSKLTARGGPTQAADHNLPQRNVG